MITKNYLTMVHSALIVTIVCTILLVAWPLSLVQADGGGPQLPPRNPPPVTPTVGDDDGEDDHNPPPGAYIELQTQSAPAEAWTVVQWQDQLGGWHEVEGWQGTLELDGSKRWWVAARDFGQSPFRWIVTQGKDGQSLAASAPFNLPTAAYEIVRSEVSLGR